MQPFSVPVLPAHPRIRPRTALVASADRSFRQRLTQILTSLRWEVREAEGGAEAWSEAEAAHPEAVIVDSWLPDLDLREFLSDFRGKFPGVDVVTAEGASAEESPRGPYRQELLYALRRSQENDTAAWNAAPAMDARRTVLGLPKVDLPKIDLPKIELPKPARPAEFVATDFAARRAAPIGSSLVASAPKTVPIRGGSTSSAAEACSAERLPEMVGNAPCMLEVSRRVRLVAPRMTPVLIEGPTGSGKELVAEALHRLSSRSRKAFVAINCAAIPESLLEAELLGTRGARLPAPCRDAPAASRPPTGERCFWMRSAKCRWGCNRSCCVLWSAASCSVWETTKPSEWMCALSPPRIGLWLRRRRRAASAPISTTGWPSSLSAPRRSWSMQRICRC